jgi:hypothetical protein
MRRVLIMTIDTIVDTVPLRRALLAHDLLAAHAESLAGALRVVDAFLLADGK